MALLDTLLILFESNIDDVEDGAEEVAKKFDDVEDSADKADDSIENMGESLTKLGKQAVGAFAALFAFNALQSGIISTAAEADEILKFSQRLGENVSDVDAWGGAIERAGGTAEGFRSSIQSLNASMVDVALKGDGEILPFFNQLGISIVDATGRARSALDVLPQLADSFEGLTAAEAAGLGAKLGLDEGTVLLLQQGRGEIDRLLERQKALGLTTEELALESAKFNDILLDYNQSLDSIGRVITVGVLPFLTAFFDGVVDLLIFLRENKAFTISFFGAIAAIIVGAYLPAILSATAATIAFLAPFLIIGLAVAGVAAAFALAADDIYNFLQGNNSAIGELSKKWPAFGKIIKSAFEGGKLGIDILKFALTQLIEFLANPIKKLQELKDLAFDTFDKAKAFFGFGDMDQENNLNIARENIVNSATVPLNEISNNTISNQSTSNQSNKTIAFTGDVIVKASSNDQEAKRNAEITGEIFKKKIREAVDNMDDGVVA